MTPMSLELSTLVQAGFAEIVGVFSKQPDKEHLKTKELTIDFRKHNTDLWPLLINGESVERIQSFNFLSIHTTDHNHGP